MGEDRGIIFASLTSLQTLFHNEHNRIADKLQEELSKTSLAVDDELVYQEAKKLVTAEVTAYKYSTFPPFQIQAITYQEYLPLILGPQVMEEYGLSLGDGVTAYDPEEDPRITNEFATVAFRFGHSQVHHHFQPYRNGSRAPDPSEPIARPGLGGSRVSTLWPLHKVYFNSRSFVLVEEGR